jgi:YD repeat-containing protein
LKNSLLTAALALAGLFLVSTLQAQTSNQNFRLVAQAKHQPFVGVWTFGDSLTFSYDTLGRITERSIFVFNDANPFAYSFFGTYEYTYVGVGNQLAGYLLENGKRGFYTYDAQGNLIEELHQLGPIDSTGWRNYLRTLREYDAGNHKISELNQQWNTDLNAWKDVNRATLTIGADGNPAVETIEVWLSVDQAWGNAAQYFYSYDASGRQIERLAKTWYQNQWVNNKLFKADYGQGLQPLSWLEHLWYDNAWNLANKEEFTYTADDQFLTRSHFYHTDTGWVHYFQVFGEYDANGNLAYKEERQWDAFTGWATVLEWYYYYDAISQASAPPALSLRIFPNPASDYCLLATPAQPFLRLDLFDASGRLVAQPSPGPGTETRIDLSQLPSGTYLLQATGSDGRRSAAPIHVQR